MKFHCIRPAARPRWQPGIVALEQTARYPLGDDFFQIDHGADYFAFFDRLGEVHYHIGLVQEQVVAVGAGILRQVPLQQGAAPQAAWYLCDLKVHPQHQTKQASMRILTHAIAQGIGRCNRGYLISMNPGDGSSNRLVKVLERFPLLPLRLAGTLNIYSVDAAQMQQLEPLLAQHRGDLSYRSLQGMKDLKLQRQGEVLPLLHVAWGQPIAAPTTATTQHSQPQPGFTHMFCAEEQDALALELSQVGILPQATASIVAHRMADCDWRFVLTSDI